jgi:hydrogenase expression/formation protein HypD
MKRPGDGPSIKALTKGLLAAIEKIRPVGSGPPVRIMEVCGTHTVSIFRSGLRALLPENIKLISGPGCPVCVTPVSFIDHALEIARQARPIVATFGDMMKVPGSASNLERARAQGADIRVVYSVNDALNIAEAEAPRKLMFLGIGFETTAPTVAGAVRAAAAKGLDNFFVLNAHKRVIPAMAALLENREVRLDAFLCPGHVSVIIGGRAYEPISEKYGKPCVVAGFEPLDVLQSLYMILTQISRGEAKTAIQYTRCVRDQGNAVSLKLMDEVFEPCDSVWRGLGAIPESGFRMRPSYAPFDAARHFQVETPPAAEHPGCRCGEVLCGLITPVECGLFGDACTPGLPVGPCMVSSEGTCSAYFKYGR